MAARTQAGEARPLQRILLATDFSTSAKYARQRVAFLPLAQAADVDVVHVLPASLNANSATLADAATAALRREADTLRQALTERGLAPNIRTHLLVGRSFECILAHAEGFSAEVIVLGRRGSGSFHALWVGSTAERVVRGRIAPVLVVNDEPTAAYSKPLIAEDVSAPAPVVLQAARRLFPPDLASLHALAVYASPLEGHLRAQRAAASKLAETLRAAEAKATRQALKRYLDQGLPADTRVRLSVRQGDARGVIEAACRRLKPDLLILGTHARKGLERFLLGSVALDVLRSSERDVLMVPRDLAS